MSSISLSQYIPFGREKGKISHTSPYLMDIITQWYGNYRFSIDDDVSLFNADMILYFLQTGNQICESRSENGCSRGTSD